MKYCEHSKFRKCIKIAYQFSHHFQTVVKQNTNIQYTDMHILRKRQSLTYRGERGKHINFREGGGALKSTTWQGPAGVI